MKETVWRENVKRKSLKWSEGQVITRMVELGLSNSEAKDTVGFFNHLVETMPQEKALLAAVDLRQNVFPVWQKCARDIAKADGITEHEAFDKLASQSMDALKTMKQMGLLR